MITDVIVVAVVALAAGFVLAWYAKAGLRERIERPKHRFLDRLERYDRDIADGPKVRGSEEPSEGPR